VKHAGAYAFDLASDGNGGTRLTQSAALEDNWLGDIVSRLVFKTTPEKARAQWQASLGNIKAILEADTPGETFLFPLKPPRGNTPGEPLLRAKWRPQNQSCNAISRPSRLSPKWEGPDGAPWFAAPQFRPARAGIEFSNATANTIARGPIALPPLSC
jgi:hypothetical protein